MTTNPSATDFLKEMGITTWQTRVTTGNSPTEIAPELNVQSALGAHELNDVKSKLFASFLSHSTHVSLRLGWLMGLMFL
jgi:hypothetical protein